MRAAIFNGPGSIEVGTRPDPIINEPFDAVVWVVLACVCGSDLWYYRGESDHAVGSIGHEFIGVVEDSDSCGASVLHLRRSRADSVHSRSRTPRAAHTSRSRLSRHSGPTANSRRGAAWWTPGPSLT